MTHSESNEHLVQAAVDAMAANDWHAAGKLWEFLANERDYTPAHFFAGAFHKHGKGLPKDTERARHHLEIAVERNHTDAKFELSGILIEAANEADRQRGIDLVMSAALAGQEKALALAHYVADQGQAMMQGQLAVQYLEGKGLPKDASLALKYARPSAEKGNPAGQWVMGYLTENGLFVRQDYVEAHMWYNLACASDNATAAAGAGIARDVLALKMTTEQVNEALVAARSWRPTSPLAAGPNSAPSQS